MFRPRLRHWAAVAIALAAVAWSSTPAEAGWWRCCPPVYSYRVCYPTCYTCYCDPCCCYGGTWYVGYRPGPIRRLLFGPYRWYYSGWSSCCAWDCCVVGCCDTVVSEPARTSTRTPAEAPPRLPAEPDVDAPPGPAGPTAAPDVPQPQADYGSETGGLIRIDVPADAKVTINGLSTKSTGAQREYASYGLKPGLRYRYEIRAEVVRDGKVIEREQTVFLTAGAQEAVAFRFEPQPDEAIAGLW